MRNVDKKVSRFAVEINSIQHDSVTYNIVKSYGGDAEVGQPFWSYPGRPRVIVMLGGDGFDPGPEWKEWRVPLLEFYIETSGASSARIENARREIYRIAGESNG